MEKDGSMSSFFMLLLSATSLIVILSEFFAGNFSFKSSAKTPPTYQDNYMNLPENLDIPEGTYLKNSEELMYVDNEDAADDSSMREQNLKLEIDATISPAFETSDEVETGL